MRAALLREINTNLIIEDVSVAEIGPGEVLVRTVACGLCHSDLHFVEGKLPQKLPTLLGHEVSGVVEAVGVDVDEFAPGDRVVGCLNTHCFQCRQCVEGRTHLCEMRLALQKRPDGSSRIRFGDEEVFQLAGLGGFAEMMLAHRSGLTRVPDGLPLDVGALLGCAVITGVGAVFNTARLRAGSTVAVVGVGGIGLNIIQGARLAGAERIIAVDVRQDKLELAASFGSTDGVLGGGVDVAAEVVELTKGGVDAAFEAIGFAETANQAFRMTRRGGATYLAGVSATGTGYDFTGNDLVLGGRSVHGVYMGSNFFKRDIPMLANLYLQGRLKLDELVSARISLNEINDGFSAMKNGDVARSVVVL
ncbi:MAG: Zn-dependent alcohol dehydrogenase [Actinomycetota bacterium]|jgi:S-(hydroxymethyl)glutathione dehydrogenase/alcohol dehydrogenase|nr:Zn-dependent alcohol dehydrogenase [Actinomycetota bacterium]